MVSDEDLIVLQQRANGGELRMSDARRLLIALLYERGVRKQLEYDAWRARTNHENCADYLQSRQQRIDDLHSQIEPLREKIAQAQEMLFDLRKVFIHPDGVTDWEMVNRITEIAMVLD